MGVAGSVQAPGGGHVQQVQPLRQAGVGERGLQGVAALGEVDPALEVQRNDDPAK